MSVSCLRNVSNINEWARQDVIVKSDGCVPIRKIEIPVDGFASNILRFSLTHSRRNDK